LRDDAFEASFASISCKTCNIVYSGDLLEHLRSFVALAAAAEHGERGVFGRAARDLAVDPSVLRRRMQTLSTWVGAPLVEGRGAGLRLTPAGARTRTHAMRAIEAVSELAYAGEDETGPLRIACTGTIVAEVLPPALRAMREKHPRLSFRVRRAGADASRELLARGEIDFAVMRSASRPEGVASLRIGPDRLWLAMPASSALAKAGRRPTLAAIARQALVGYGRQSSTFRRVMEVMGPLGAAPWIEVDGKSAALSYVAEGLGVAFVSVLATQRFEQRGVVLVDVTASFPQVAFWLVWPARAKLVAWKKTFVDSLTRTSSSR
jgi:DNA-binding transcriptional LysR family regulator